MADIQSEGAKSLEQRIYNDDAKANRHIIRAQDPSDGSWVNVGAHENSDGTYSINTAVTNVQNRVSTLNSTTTPLGAGGVFTGTFEDLKDYASVSILLRTDKNSAEDGTTIEWSDDGVNVRRVSKTTVTGLANDGYHFAVARQARYARLKYTNGSVAQTVFIVQIIFNTVQTGASYVPIAANLDSLFTAEVVKAVVTGQQPDGDFVNASADGVAFETGSTLGSGGIYTSAWQDTDQWRSLELFIATNVASANNGIEIQFTDDVQAGTPTVRATIYRTFSAADVTRGFVVYRLPALLDGVRVKYTNGGTGQSSFYLALNIRSFAVENPQTTLDGSLGLSDTSLLSRSIITGVSTSGTTYNNMTIVPITNSAGTYYSMPVVSGARPSDIPGRTSVTKNIANVTADTQIHTTTATKTFYLTDIIIEAENDNSTGATAYIRDGTSAAGTIRIPIRVEAKQGSATKLTSFTHAFNEPIPFTSGVYYDEVDDLTTSVVITGYEE